jgi:hypothetical protein
MAFSNRLVGVAANMLLSALVASKMWLESVRRPWDRSWKSYLVLKMAYESAKYPRLQSRDPDTVMPDSLRLRPRQKQLPLRGHQLRSRCPWKAFSSHAAQGPEQLSSNPTKEWPRRRPQDTASFFFMPMEHKTPPMPLMAYCYMGIFTIGEYH